MSHIARVFHSLEGPWKFQRFSDLGNVQGIAKFQKIERNDLHYREDGIFFDTQGKSYRVYREFLYRFGQEEISVFFAEKPIRLLHTLEFVNPLSTTDPVNAKARHLCNCDTYDAEYEFRLPQEFSLTYTVKGPNKDYFMSTFFKRYLQENN